MPSTAFATMAAFWQANPLTELQVLAGNGRIVRSKPVIRRTLQQFLLSLASS